MIQKKINKTLVLLALLSLFIANFALSGESPKNRKPASLITAETTLKSSITRVLNSVDVHLSKTMQGNNKAKALKAKANFTY